MWPWVALCFVGAAESSASGSPEVCNVTIAGDAYREETFMSEIHLPKSLTVDHSTNLLYFTSERHHQWYSIKLNLTSGEFSNMEGLSGVCRFAVDQVQHEVYAGCSSTQGGGLYSCHSGEGRCTLVGEAGQRVEFVYHNENLYYSKKYAYSLLTFKSGIGSPVQEITSKVNGLVIDKLKDWIFYNTSGLFRQRAGTEEGFLYPELHWPRALAVDSHGDTYVCDWYFGIYRLHEQTPTATKLLNVRRCIALTFDRDDNMIYIDGVDNKIVRLVKCAASQDNSSDVH